MIDTIIFILASSMPLVLVTLGALCSEKAGRMVFFIDGLVTISAFIFYSSLYKTGNIFGSALICVMIPLLFVFLVSLVVEKLKFDSFIASLAENVFLLSLVSVISVLLFKTRGVLSFEKINFSQSEFKLTSISIGIIFIILSALFLFKTKAGLYLRITGSDSEVLLSAGVKPKTFRILSWMIASVLSSLAGIILVVRLSSFVPGISSGIGWICLAIVFLGKRKYALCVIYAFVFGVAQFLSNNIQNVEVFKNLPSALLLSMPYLIVIVFMLVLPGKDK